MKSHTLLSGCRIFRVVFTVIVPLGIAPGVPNPLYVRYAWAYAIPQANLFNLNGFPSLTFRTDANK